MSDTEKIDVKTLITELIGFEYVRSNDYLYNFEEERIIIKLIKEVTKYRPDEKSHLSRCCFDSAIRIIAAEFLLEDYHSISCDSSNIKHELHYKTDSLDQSHLIELLDYTKLIEGLEWSDEKDYFYKRNAKFVETFSFETVANLLEIYILEQIDKYTLQLKTYFTTNYEKQFWYNLYHVNKDDMKEESYNYDAERIDNIIRNILSL